MHSLLFHHFFNVLDFLDVNFLVFNCVWIGNLTFHLFQYFFDFIWLSSGGGSLLSLFSLLIFDDIDLLVHGCCITDVIILLAVFNFSPLGNERINSFIVIIIQYLILVEFLVKYETVKKWLIPFPHLIFQCECLKTRRHFF